MKKRSLVLSILGLLLMGCSHANKDLIIADFEGYDYGSWKVEGEAFGRGPAHGSLPNQQHVSGYQGKGLVNTFYQGDKTTGRLISKPFEIERFYINFLIGGGPHAGQTCINLLVDGKVVRTSAGSTGSELLDWTSWDVKELMGKTAHIEIVDRHTGSWGHINVDHIYQSDQMKGVGEKTRNLRLTRQYLNLPVDDSAPKRSIEMRVDGRLVRQFDISIANEEIDYWVFLDVREFKGKDAAITIDRTDLTEETGFDQIYQADTFPGTDELYKEKLRPQFHFTSRRGWNNDTNGMVYYDGEYHLFYQHNPYGWPWGNMTWGHAVSRDMVHWTELGDAIHPDGLGTIYSGSAVVDRDNCAGFKTGDEDPIVCFYTYAGGENPWSNGQPYTQAIAYSNDRGRTFTKYEGNPVIGHIRGGNRDPKVIWHEPTKKWVMVLYVENHEMDFFTSADLKNWTHTSRLKCFHECPELFELPVDGDENNKKWVIYGAAADYLVGAFDGKEFKPETQPLKFNYGNAFYASQTFSDIPAEDGRRIMMGWGRVPMPGMPFNQMVTFPVELSLKTTDEGIRMFAEPVQEIRNLHQKKHAWKNETIEGVKTLSGIEGELFHIKAEFNLKDAKSFALICREYEVKYDAQSQQIVCKGPANKMVPGHFANPYSAPLKPVNGKIKFEILVDRTYVEVFVNGGRYYFPMGAYLVDKDPAIKVISDGGKTELLKLEINELNSIWK